MHETNNNDFYYPENLTEKNTFIAGWEWWALAIMAPALFASVVLIFIAQMVMPILFTALFAVLSLKISGVFVSQYIFNIINFAFAEQMVYFYEGREILNGSKNKKK